MTDPHITLERFDLDAVRGAIKKTEYKYFGDYEFSDDQREAVDLLIDFATAILAQNDGIVV